MLQTFAITLLLAAPSSVAPASQERPIPLMTPLEHVSDPLERALSSLTHAANQTCDVKAAIVDIKAALSGIAAAETFLAQHRDAALLSPLPPAVTPDFTAPPRPAPRRNEMLEAALTSLGTAFQRASEAPGSDWGGGRDRVYGQIDDGAKHLLAAIKSANTAFAQGRRELPSCKPDSDGGE